MIQPKTLAIVVNYKAASLTLASVLSIQESASVGPLQTVVIDNSQDSSEVAFLKNRLPDSVELMVNLENMGFGRACNKVFQKYDSDYVLLLNPDARLLSGCLFQLQRTLSHYKKLGAVGPQIFWEDRLEYFLPPSYLDIFFWIDPIFSVLKKQYLSYCWRYFSIHVWKATLPIRVMNLSGGHVLINRKAVDSAGGLFDPAFFLYYEDTDLFIRLRRAGYSLMVDPKAKVVHYYDQCDRKNWESKRRMMMESHFLFIKKYSRGWRKTINRLANMLPNWKSDFSLTDNAFIHYTSPFTLYVPRHLRDGWLFEWSPNSDFIPSIGKFGKGQEMRFSEEQWQLLSPGKYYGRIGSIFGFFNSYHIVTWTINE